MLQIRPSYYTRIFFLIGGIFCLIGGISFFPRFLFPSSNSIELFVFILVLMMSLAFIVGGLWAIYVGSFYRINIDHTGISKGSDFYQRSIPKKDIRGYFTAKLFSRRNNYRTDFLILQLTDQSQISFDSSTFGENLILIKKEVTKQYKKLPSYEGTLFQNKVKIKGYKFASMLGLSMTLIGLYFLFKSVLYFENKLESITLSSLVLIVGFSLFFYYRTEANYLEKQNNKR